MRGGPGWSAKVRAVVARCKGYCECGCGEPLDPGPRFGFSFHVDHNRPLCDGGSDELSNLRAMKPGHHRKKTEIFDRPRWMAVSRPPLRLKTARELREIMPGRREECPNCGHGMSNHRVPRARFGAATPTNADARVCEKPVFTRETGGFKPCGCEIKMMA